MTDVTEEPVKRWTAKRNSALVVDIINGKTTVAGERAKLGGLMLRLSDLRSKGAHQGQRLA